MSCYKIDKVATFESDGEFSYLVFSTTFIACHHLCSHILNKQAAAAGESGGAAGACQPGDAQYTHQARKRSFGRRRLRPQGLRGDQLPFSPGVDEQRHSHLTFQGESSMAPHTILTKTFTVVSRDNNQCIIP